MCQIGLQLGDDATRDPPKAQTGDVVDTILFEPRAERPRAPSERVAPCRAMLEVETAVRLRDREQRRREARRHRSSAPGVVPAVPRFDITEVGAPIAVDVLQRFEHEPLEPGVRVDTHAA
jgi:hypothetical protein